MAGQRNTIRIGTAGAPRSPGIPVTKRIFFHAVLSGFLLLAAANCSISQTGPQSGWNWANPLPQGNDLLGVDAIDANTIIAVGKLGTCLKSSDGGFNWRKLDVATNPDISLKSV